MRSASTPKAARITSDLPEPTSPARPTISPARDGERNVRHRPLRRREVLDAEPLLAGREADLREELGDHPAGHQPHQFVVARGPGVEGRHIAAVAEHGDAVADPADLLHAVGDVDDADALAP